LLTILQTVQRDPITEAYEGDTAIVVAAAAAAVTKLPHSPNTFTKAQVAISSSVKSTSPANTNKELSKDLSESVQQFPHKQGLIELAATTTEEVFRPFGHADPELPDPHDVLSEDEGDVHTLKGISLSKVMSWNDGSKKLVVNHAAVHIPGEKSLNEIADESPSQPFPSATPESSEKPQTIQPFKNHPLKGMVPTEPAKMFDYSPNLSFLGVSEIRRYGNLAEKENRGSSRLYAEAVTRTPNAETDTVTVSSLPRKRRGKRGQPSYFDITSELHYLR